MRRSLRAIIKIGNNFSDLALLKDKIILYTEGEKLNILNKYTFKKEFYIDFKQNITKIKLLKNNNIIIQMKDKLTIIELKGNNKTYNIIQEINGLSDITFMQSLLYNKYSFSIIYDKKVDLYTYKNCKYLLDKNILLDTCVRRILDVKNNKLIIISREYKKNIFYLYLYDIENCKKEKVIIVDLTNYERLNQTNFNCVSGLEIGNNLIVSIASFLYLIDMNYFEIVQKILYQLEESQLHKKWRVSCTLNRTRALFRSFQINRFVYKKNFNLFLGLCHNKLYFLKIENKEMKIIGQENLEKINDNFGIILEIYKYNNNEIEFISYKYDFFQKSYSLIIYELILNK